MPAVARIPSRPLARRRRLAQVSANRPTAKEYTWGLPPAFGRDEDCEFDPAESGIGDADGLNEQKASFLTSPLADLLPVCSRRVLTRI